jgi:polysaccharide pyruvyl transferase WcaK-like protein
MISYGPQPVEIRLHRGIVQPAPFYCAVFLGGGTLINWRGYYDRFENALNQGIPGVVFGTGVLDPSFWQQQHSGVDYHQSMQEWVNLLRRAQLVTVRGPQSAALLDGYGLKDVQIIGDPALSVSMPRRAAGNEQTGLVGFNLGSHGPIWGNQGKLNIVALATLKILLKQGRRIEFVPMHPNDLEIARAIRRELGGKISIWRNFHDIPQTLSRFRDYDFLIGERLHSLVFAAAAGVPVVALEYRPKVSDFMESLDLRWFSLRTDIVTVDSILERTARITDEYSLYQARLSEKVRYYQQIQRQAAEKVGNLIGGQ